MRIIKTSIFLGVLICALSSMNVILTMFHGITAGPVFAAIIGYPVGAYLFYYGIFAREEPTLKERIKEEQTHKEKTSEV